MVRTFVVTLITGTPINLLSSLAGLAVGASPPQTTAVRQLDLALRRLDLQPRGTNAAPVYVGQDNTTSSTNYGVRLEAAVATIPPAPYPLGDFNAGPLHFSDVWALGTTGDFLHVLGVPF